MAIHDLSTSETGLQAVVGDHPDAVVFGAVHAIHDADAATAAILEPQDAAHASGDAARIAAADAAVEATHAAYLAAIDTLAACAPQTSAGVQAMLAALARFDPPSPEWLTDVLARLAEAPALAA